MAVDAHDHFARGYLQALVQGVWHHALGVVEQFDEGIFFSIAPHDLCRMISTPAVDEEHLELILGIILLQNRRYTLLNESFFIEKRADD